MEEKQTIEKGPNTHASDTSDTEAVKSCAVEEIQESCFSAPETKRLLRKLDFTLLPFLSLLYLLSFLDRANIGNAKLAGLEKDLGMTGKYDYNVSLWDCFRLFFCGNIVSFLLMVWKLDCRVHLLPALRGG